MADAARKPDLAVRTVSGVVMVVLAVMAFWQGGAVLTLFVVAVTLGVLLEAWGLVRRITPVVATRAAAMLALGGYAVGAAAGLLSAEPAMRWVAVAGVVATDVGAYFAGRSIGGPKIVPSISPSKTWAGLFGGMAGAAVVLLIALLTLSYALSGFGGGEPSVARMDVPGKAIGMAIVAGAVLAVVAQAGDFFESWLKRRAGVKDSGKLIPGHGGLFDRVDGLLAVACLLGLVQLTGWI